VERACIGGGSDRRTLTVSIGVACLPGDGTGEAQLVDSADRALYMAKGLGKNRVKTVSDERREHPRVDAILLGRFSRLAEESRPLATGNLSEGGLLFSSPEPLPLGSLVQVRLALAPSEAPVEGVLRVARVLPGPGGYEVGASFIHMARPDRRRLRAYLTARRASDEAGLSLRPATHPDPAAGAGSGVHPDR
jgi:hypothetical protein